MATTQLSIDEVNSLSHARFVEVFGSLFEGSPWIVERAWSSRPWEDLDRLHRALCAVMYGARQEEKEALIRAHPDLVDEAALAGTLTAESTREQAAAGLDRLSPEERATFTSLNKEYRERFGFPFVICARENKKESIVAGFAARLHNTRDQEIGAALIEIAKIARLRLRDLINSKF